MQFLTILKPKTGRYHIRAIRTARGYYFDDFEYELSDDPTAEGVRVRFGPDMGRHLPQASWPEVEVGARLGFEDALRCGVRFCCVGFAMIAAKYHDLDTSPRGIHSNVSYCVSDSLVRQSEPIPPLRAEWLTSDVVALARGIHAKQALDGIPALRDALLEAECDDPLVIEHLQTCPDHSPSCWVVEMILDQAAARDGLAG